MVTILAGLLCLGVLLIFAAGSILLAVVNFMEHYYAGYLDEEDC